MVLKYCSGCQEKCDPEVVALETIDLPRTLIIYYKCITTRNAFRVTFAGPKKVPIVAVRAWVCFCATYRAQLLCAPETHLRLHHQYCQTCKPPARKNPS